MKWLEHKVCNISIGTILLAAVVISLPMGIALNNLALLFLLAFAIVQYIFKPVPISLSNAIILLPALLFFGYLAGWIWSDSLTEGWDQLEKKLFLLALPAAVWMMRSHLDKKNRDFLYYTFVALSLIISVVCYANAFYEIITNLSFKVVEEKERDYYYFSYIYLSSIVKIDPIYLSFFPNISIIILLFRPLKSRLWTYLLIVYNICFIILISSKIGIVWLLICFTLCLFIRLRNKMVAALAYFLAVIALIVFVNESKFLSDRFNVSTEFNYSYAHASYWNSTSQRIAIWTCGWSAVSKAFPLGYGTGDGQKALNEEYRLKNYVRGYEDDYNAHSEYLYTLLDLGVPGLILVLSITVYPMILVFQKQQYIFAFFILLMLTYWSIEVILYRRIGIVVFSLFYPLFSTEMLSKTKNVERK